MDKKQLLDTLHSEVIRTAGCTDPASIALAVARATEALGQKPTKIVATVSPNIYKNALSVGVPGTGRSGAHIAAALGAVIGNSQHGLALMETITNEMLVQAGELLQNGQVQVTYADAPDVLHINAEVSANGTLAHAVITGDYDNFTSVSRNGSSIYSCPLDSVEHEGSGFQGATLADLIDLVMECTPQELAFLHDAASVNRRAAETSLDHPSMSFGASLRQPLEHLSQQQAIANHTQVLVAAAAEARMSGLSVPIMAIAGSGNQGICNFLGVMGAAEILGSAKDDLLRALAISSAVTVYIQSFAARMTAFCGGAVSAAAGVAAAVTYLLGGSKNQISNAIQSHLGTLAGIICDGAKVSCAYKLVAGIGQAIQSAYLAMDGVYLERMGIVAGNVDQTIRNIGIINNEGMLELDQTTLQVIQTVQAT